MSDYTEKQMEYISSVDGKAHMSAVEIIGRLESLNEDKFQHLQAYCKEASKDKVKIAQLQAENKRLREALEEIAENSSCFVALVTATEAINENK